MKRIVLSSLIAISAMMGSGCASLYKREVLNIFNGPQYAGLYPGIRGDAEFAFALAWEHPDKWPSVFFSVPAALLDLPLSAFLDTICLPSDLSEWRRRRELERSSHPSQQPTGGKRK
jgi:uncharacterized protein YceK